MFTDALKRPLDESPREHAVSGDGLQQGDGLLPGQGRRGVLLHPGRHDRYDVVGVLPEDEACGREPLVSAARHVEMVV
jgi:hypothetical protein